MIQIKVEVVDAATTRCCFDWIQSSPLWPAGLLQFLFFLSDRKQPRCFCLSICHCFSMVYSFCHLSANHFAFILFCTLLAALTSWNLLYCLPSYISAANALTCCRPCVFFLLQIYGVFARYPKVQAAPEGAVSGPYPASDLHWLGSEVLQAWSTCVCVWNYC